MQFHFDLAMKVSRAMEMDIRLAARLLGRVKAAMGTGFYGLVGIDNVVPVVTEIAAADSVFIDGESRHVFLDGFGDDGGARFDDMLDGYLKTMWADAWASGQEEMGASLSGDLTELSPPAADEAVIEACMCIGQIEGSNSMSVDAIWEAAERAALLAGQSGHRKLSAERLGSCLYYEASGHGVAWTDDFPVIPGFETPHIEHMIDAASPAPSFA